MGQSEVFGITTTCGSESLLSVMYAYREWGLEKGISEPNM